MKVKLPNDIIRSLEELSIQPDDILTSFVADITRDKKFTYEFLLLTVDKLILIPTQNKGDVYQFGGYRQEDYNKDLITSKPNVYLIDEIKELFVIQQINGGILAAKTDKEEQVILFFSNSKMMDCNTFIREFDRLKSTTIRRKKNSREKLKNESDDSCKNISGVDSKNEEKDSRNDGMREERRKERFARCPKCGLIYPDQERKICPKCMDKRSIFFRVLGYFKLYKVKIFFMILCYIGTAAINLIWPYLNGTILYDKVLKKDPAFLERFHLPEGRFLLLLGAVVVTMLVSKMVGQLFGIIQGCLTAKLVPDVIQNIKADVFQSMGKLSISFYNNRQTGSLMTRVLNDAEEVTGFFIDGLPYFLINILTILFCCTAMLTIHTGLAVASFVLLPILFLISYIMLPRLWSFYGRRHRANRSMNGQLNDNLTGVRVIKAFGQEEKEIRRFETYNKRVRNAEMEIVGFDNRFYALYNTVEHVISLIAWGFGAALVLGNSGLELGILITFISYVSMLNGPLEFLSQCFRQWTNSMNSAQRIFEITDSLPEVIERPDPVKTAQISGEIELSHVTFSYDVNKPVLKDISFHIQAGEMLGIVGRSGVGKSTLVNLISRLYDPQEGEIRIDGINVKDMGFHDLRRSIAMVSQETYIFMGTVAENIAYARPEASRAEIIAAAIRASAHDFICKLNDGYDTMLGSSGHQLSGGERQRISIARAILADPKILILDEATAAVDTETELAIKKSLEQLAAGRTTLLIAHRLSTLNNAHRIIVIDDGKLTEIGTHEELLEKKGTFYRLMQLQNKALSIRAVE